jgi:hypothetical protein
VAPHSGEYIHHVSPSITVVCERPDDSTSWRSLSGGSTQKRI